MLETMQRLNVCPLAELKLTKDGFNDILEALMQQAGPQGPIPATDAVIEGLPRSTLDEQSIGAAYTSCLVTGTDLDRKEPIQRLSDL